MYCVKCDYVEMYVTVHDCEGLMWLCMAVQGYVRLFKAAYGYVWLSKAV